MTVFSRPARSGLFLACLAVLGLSGCEEKEVILTGEREDLRPAEVQDATVRLDPRANTSRPIRLAAQRNNAEWAQSFGTPEYRTAHPALSSSPRRVWSVSIGQGDSRRQRITASPVVGGGLIYTLDASALISAVTPAGQVAWSTDLTPRTDGDEDATGGGMAYDDGVLYVSSGYGLLTALDAQSGEIRWQQKLEATGSGQPLVRNGLIYLVAGDDTGWAIETDTGRIAWQVLATPSIANVLGAPAPVVTGPLTVFAFGSGDLISTFRRGGLRRWDASVKGQSVGSVVSRYGDITGAPVLVGKTLYIGNHSGRIAALSADSGERLWTRHFGAVDPVWPAGGSLFVLTERSQLVRMNASDGAPVWVVELPHFVKDKPKKREEAYAHYGPILAGGQVITASNDGLLRFYAPEDGTQTMQIELPGGASSAPVVAGQTLYVVSSNGQLHAFR